MAMPIAVLLAIVRAPAADVNFFSVSKGILFAQTNAGAPQLKSGLPYLFQASVVAATNGLTSATMQWPSGTRSLVQRLPGGPYTYTDRQPTAGLLDLFYPNGDFTFTMNTINDGSRVAVLTLGDGVNPPAPTLLNYAGTQMINPSNNFTLQWGPFAGGSANDFIHVRIDTTTGTVFRTAFAPGLPGALNGFSSSVVIPSNTLPAGRALSGRIIFSKVAPTNVPAYPAVTGALIYYTQTEFFLTTTGAGDVTPPRVVSTVPIDGATGVEINSPFAMNFSEPTRQSFSVFINGTIAGRSFAWNPGGTTLVATPTSNWPPSTSIGWVLNPSDALPFFGDLNNNPLAPETVIHFATGTSAPPLLAMHGRVTDTLGVGISNATIFAAVGLTPFAQASADASGNYALSPLGASVYVLTASAPGHEKSSRVLTLSAGTVFQNFQLTAMPGPPATQAVNRQPDLSYITGPNGSALKVFNGTSFVAITTNNWPPSDRMTIVLTHGWNSDPAAWASNMASSFRGNGVTANMANIVAWDWRTNALGPVIPPAPPVDQTPVEGVALGQVLLGVFGGGYSQPIHFTGHSLGALVNAAAANYLHGTKTAQQQVSPTPWSWSRTHITIFDHAERANLAGRQVLFDGLNPTAVDAFNAAFSEGNTTQNWMPALPMDFAWADNYVSLVGFSKSRAVNIWLQQAALETGASAKHSYPMNWYGLTITNPPGAQLGFQRSREYGLMVGLPTSAFPPSSLGGAYYQPLFASDRLTLQPQLTPSQIPSFLADKTVKAAAGVVQFTGDVTATIQNAAQTTGQAILSGFNYVGDVAAHGGQTVVNLYDSAVLRLRLHTTPAASQSLTALRSEAQRQGASADSNSTPMAWLPTQFPANAIAMAFDFTVEGNPMDDVLVCGIGKTNLFSLEAKYIPTNTMSASRLIDVSAWAGTTNELFFGFLRGTSTNATLVIENIRFYSVEAPRLAITRDGGGAQLSWSSNAGGYVVETTPTLAALTWETVTNAPMIFGDRYVLTDSSAVQSRFYRLRERRTTIEPRTIE